MGRIARQARLPDVNLCIYYVYVFKPNIPGRSVSSCSVLPSVSTINHH